MHVSQGRSFKSFTAIAGLLCAALISSATAAVTITHNYSDAPKEQLALEILKLVLANDPSGTDYTYQPLDENVDEARLVQMLKDGEVSVMWAGMQEAYEKAMIPVRIPMFKGLLGHRIFIIRDEDQAKFDQVQTLEDLKKIPAGQGRFWGDTAIMQHSGLNVVTTVKYEGLFHMLDGERFDYFPRAVHEPWTEVVDHGGLDLTVEKNILLIYPFAMYFFVSQDNPDLAKRIEAGFWAAIQNGSFDQLFFSHPVVKEALGKSQLQNRKVFRIPNPNMTPETPVDKKELWLDINDLDRYL